MYHFLFLLLSMPILKKKDLSCNMRFPTMFVFCLSDLVLYVTSANFQLYRDGSSWVEPVLS